MCAKLRFRAVRKDRICPLLVCAALGFGALAVGCAASVQGKAKAGASVKEEDNDRKWELGPTGAADPAAPTKPSDGPAKPSDAQAGGLSLTPAEPGEVRHFIGVVHDLSLGPAADKSPVCSCLMLTYGRPNSGKFKWRGGQRGFDKDTMAVAIGSEGIACNMMVGGKAKDLGPASIAGIDHEGGDLVVIVEEARRGIPIAHGALVKALDPGAGIIVKGTGDVPFGTPLGGGKGVCKVSINQ
jgi:hypothetical protein